MALLRLYAVERSAPYKLVFRKLAPFKSAELSHELLVIWDKGGNLHSMSVHQFGSSTLHEDSLHYADQSPLLANRQLKPVWSAESDIRAHLEREYAPGEEK